MFRHQYSYWLNVIKHNAFFKADEVKKIAEIIRNTEDLPLVTDALEEPLFSVITFEVEDGTLEEVKNVREIVRDWSEKLGESHSLTMHCIDEDNPGDQVWFSYRNGRETHSATEQVVDTASKGYDENTVNAVVEYLKSAGVNAAVIDGVKDKFRPQ